eukprot:symbB.v1.2.012510.t1/scaffold866.1/size156716/5
MIELMQQWMLPLDTRCFSQKSHGTWQNAYSSLRTLRSHQLRSDVLTMTSSLATTEWTRTHALLEDIKARSLEPNMAARTG